MIPRLLSRGEAAAYLGRCERTFDAEVAEGVWPSAIRPGRKRVWDRVALDRKVDLYSGFQTKTENHHEATTEKVDELFGRPWPSIRRKAR